LLDRVHLPGGVTKRHPCSSDSATDSSLLSPQIQPQFGKSGPINVFGPYSDDHSSFNQAKSRSTLAYFQDVTGANYVFVTGSTKRSEDLSVSAPPGLARLKIVTTPGRPAYLRLDQLENTQTLQNPGSPIVTSHGGADAIVCVLDTNAARSAPLYGPTAPQPILYAFDALSLKLLWKSRPGVLFTSGKYNEPAVVNGVVFVGTDRIQAFGLRPVQSEAEDAAAQKFTPLFDGKTLKHWRGDPAVWSVRDGAITGQFATSIAKNTFLIHEGNFRNFELHFKYRFLTPQGTSGLQYRSRPYLEDQTAVAGYMASVTTPEAKERFAMLWEENARGRNDAYNANMFIDSCSQLSDELSFSTVQRWFFTSCAVTMPPLLPQVPRT